MITLNPDIKKLNRKEAFSVVRESLETGEPMPNCALEALYKHFAPSKPKNVKEPWQWVAKAVAKNDVRGMLCWLYSDGERLIGCDGHRLHIIPTDLPNGYYDPKTCDPVSFDMQYPDIDRVIPRDLIGPVYLEDHNQVDTICDVQAVNINDVWFNQTYINDAVSFGETWAIASESDSSKLYASNDDGYQFVVMGLTRK
jgi:hypothetical protein